jgi:hypothetical protein
VCFEHTHTHTHTHARARAHTHTNTYKNKQNEIISNLYLLCFVLFLLCIRFLTCFSVLPSSDNSVAVNNNNNNNNNNFSIPAYINIAHVFLGVLLRKRNLLGRCLLSKVLSFLRHSGQYQHTTRIYSITTQVYCN